MSAAVSCFVRLLYQCCGLAVFTMSSDMQWTGENEGREVESAAAKEGRLGWQGQECGLSWAEHKIGERLVAQRLRYNSKGGRPAYAS